MALSKQQAQFSLLSSYKPIDLDFNKEAFKSTLQQLWHCSHGVTIKDVGNNLFLTIFVKEENILKFKTKALSLLIKDFLLKHFNGDLSLVMLLFNVLLFGFGFLTFKLKIQIELLALV